MKVKSKPSEGDTSTKSRDKIAKQFATRSKEHHRWSCGYYKPPNNKKATKKQQ
jgi:hypothetical protein